MASEASKLQQEMSIQRSDFQAIETALKEQVRELKLVIETKENTMKNLHDNLLSVSFIRNQYEHENQVMRKVLSHLKQELANSITPGEDESASRYLVAVEELLKWMEGDRKLLLGVISSLQQENKILGSKEQMALKENQVLQSELNKAFIMRNDKMSGLVQENEQFTSVITNLAYSNHLKSVEIAYLKKNIAMLKNEITKKNEMLAIEAELNRLESNEDDVQGNKHPNNVQTEEASTAGRKQSESMIQFDENQGSGLFDLSESTMENIRSAMDLVFGCNAAISKQEAASDDHKGTADLEKETFENEDASSSSEVRIPSEMSRIKMETDNETALPQHQPEFEREGSVKNKVEDVFPNKSSDDKKDTPCRTVDSPLRSSTVFMDPTQPYMTNAHANSLINEDAFFLENKNPSPPSSPVSCLLPFSQREPGPAVVLACTESSQATSMNTVDKYDIASLLIQCSPSEASALQRSTSPNANSTIQFQGNECRRHVSDLAAVDSAQPGGNSLPTSSSNPCKTSGSPSEHNEATSSRRTSCFPCDLSDGIGCAASDRDPSFSLSPASPTEPPSVGQELNYEQVSSLSLSSSASSSPQAHNSRKETARPASNMSLLSSSSNDGPDLNHRLLEKISLGNEKADRRLMVCEKEKIKYLEKYKRCRAMVKSQRSSPCDEEDLRIGLINMSSDHDRKRKEHIVNESKHRFGGRFSDRSRSLRSSMDTDSEEPYRRKRKKKHKKKSKKKKLSRDFSDDDLHDANMNKRRKDLKSESNGLRFELRSEGYFEERSQPTERNENRDKRFVDTDKYKYNGSKASYSGKRAQEDSESRFEPESSSAMIEKTKLSFSSSSRKHFIK